MKMISRVFDKRGAPLLTAIFLVLIMMEGRRQLRRRKLPRVKRLLTNSLVSVPAFSLLRFVFLPLMIKLAMKNNTLRFGLNYHYKGHRFVKAMVAILVMDYTNFLWHILNHRVPLLWRFHLVHHTDPDLDVTTALRFHFGELIGSVFYRGLFVFLSGATPLTVLIYEIIFETATQFHHSNWKLPYRWEKGLNKIIVTPRMHGLHHSVVRQETDSNFSVIFSAWDRLHSTFRTDNNEHPVITGVPSYQNFDEQTVGYLLRLPFTGIRPWA